jgi:predicted permease
VFADVRYALRLLRRTPGATTSAILTLGLGIGVTTAIYSVVYAVLFRPLPIAADRGAVAVFVTMPSMQRSRDAVSGVRFDEWRARADVFTDMAASNRKPFDLMVGGTAERLDGEIVSGNFFEVLGVSALHGRVFTTRDEEAPDVVPCVISEALWRRYFSADPAILGRRIRSSGPAMTIVGVVPDAFARWRDPVALWAPYKLTPALLPPATLSSDGYRTLQVIGRLKPGVGVDQARTSLARLDEQLDVALRQPDPSRGVDVIPLREVAVDARLRRSLSLLAAIAVLILLLASANVGSQLIARSVPRRREWATRTALGGTQWRLTMQLATETTMLAALGGAVGVLIAVWTIPFLTLAAPREIGRLPVIAFDGAAGLLALASTSIVVLLIGTLAALRLSDIDLMGDLRGASVSTPAKASTRAQVLLVAGQLTIAVPVVVAAGLMATSVVRLLSIDPGFETRRLLTVKLNLPGAAYSTAEAALQFHERVLARVRALPGVEAVAAGQDPVDYLAANRVDAGVSITVERGRRFLNGVAADAPYTPGRRRVSPDYFETLGLALIEGRGFTGSDGLAGVRVAVVNESMARLHWPGQRAIGKRINFENVRPNRPLSEPWTEIVGVVADARQHRFDGMPRPEVYTPLSQTPYLLSTSTLLVRSASSSLDVSGAVRRAIHDIDVSVPVFDMRTMSSIIDEATATPRYAANLVSLFAALALTLAAVGIYGLGALAAAQRRREIAIRMALGATRAEVLRFALAVGLRPAAVGIAAGAAAAAFGARLLGALLYEVEPSNPVVLASAVSLLLVVAFCATYLPAWRAAAIDPVAALRAE